MTAYRPRVVSSKSATPGGFPAAFDAARSVAYMTAVPNRNRDSAQEREDQQLLVEPQDLEALFRQAPTR